MTLNRSTSLSKHNYSEIVSKNQAERIVFNANNKERNLLGAYAGKTVLDHEPYLNSEH